MHNGSLRGRPANLAPMAAELDPNVTQAFLEANENNDLEKVAESISFSHVPLIEIQNNDGETALLIASRLGHVTLVKVLLKSGANVGARDYEYWTSLLNAARNGNVEIVQLLLDSGADIEEADIGGFTALEWACYKDRIDVVRHLLSRRANVNVLDEHGMTPLLWAAARGYDEIVQELIQAGARVSVRDKFGNSPLLWACRKSYVDVALPLISAGAAVDVVGMQSSTPLILAAKNSDVDIVEAILRKGCNLNSVDQNGMSALAHAAHEGCLPIVEMLLEDGAYVNVADKKSDTILMKAVKSGNLDVVRSLLQKHADVDAQDEEGRTVLHLAIDKGWSEILSLLLEYRPNLEIRAKDGDTALLRAVRTRNVFMVELLVRAGSKVSATDRRGDTSLHIGLRCRSKRLTQLLLTRPQDSRLLYQANKMGETPYSIDQSHTQLILPHIFGPAESHVQTEAMLGYDIYSSVMADIMCEPNLSLPLTVGLYAKWGSGKSFLLNKLKESLSLFSRSWMEAKTLKWSWTLNLFLILISAFIAAVVCGVPGVGSNWLIPMSVGLCLSLVLIYCYAFIVYGRWSYCRLARNYLTRPYAIMQLMAQILFYRPPTLHERDLVARPVRFLFADYHRLSSIGGAQALASIIETLYSELERHYGIFPVRLCQAFQPAYSGNRQSMMKRWCGLPVALICCIMTFLGVLGLYFCMVYSTVHWSKNLPPDHVNESPFLFTGGLLLVCVLIPASYPLALTIAHMTFLRPKSKIRRAVADLNRLQFEGLMQKLKREVTKIVEVVRRLDSFTRSQTRMVVFVDGLDSCEQDRMLQALDAIQILFGSNQNAPFIVLIAVDPHIVVTAIQQAMHSAFTATDISGHDYLKNLIQMPFYLQNTAIRKLHEQLRDRERSESGNDARFSFVRQDTMFGSKLSLADSYRSSTRMRRGVSQQLHATDVFSQRIIRDDYFSNINPRSMRRIVNTLALTGRLMRAFEIDFNWVALGHWVSLVEQWPYRLSWLIDYCERQQLGESITLHEVYQIIKQKIPAAKSEDPLIEIDRNHRNLDIYLESSREPMLTVGHLRQFVPFTSNLDPYIRKLIHERYENAMVTTLTPQDTMLDPLQQTQPAQQLSSSDSTTLDLQKLSNVSANVEIGSGQRQTVVLVKERMPLGLEQFFKDSIWQVRLSCLTVDEVCSLIKRLPLSSSNTTETLCHRFREINASGLVLSFCDLDQLKSELRATFGDWELIALMIRTLRARERDYGQMDETNSRSQSVEPVQPPAASQNRRYSAVGGPTVGTGGGSASLALALAKRRGTTGPRRKISTPVGSTIDYNSSSDHMAEVAAQHDWLHTRLGHLDSTEFDGDRDLVDSTPRTSRRSSIIREENMMKLRSSVTNSSYDDVVSPALSSAFTSPGQLTRDLSPSVSNPTTSPIIPSKTTGGSDSAMVMDPALVATPDETKSNLTQRLKGLIGAAGGSTEEKGRLLGVHSSDTEDEEEKTQLTVKRKPNEEPRPSVFQLVQTTKAASVPSVNTVGVDSLMEMNVVTAVASSDQAVAVEKSTNVE